MLINKILIITGIPNIVLVVENWVSHFWPLNTSIQWIVKINYLYHLKKLLIINSKH